MKTREVCRIVEGPVVARMTATMANLQLHGTQCIYTVVCGLAVDVARYVTIRWPFQLTTAVSTVVYSGTSQTLSKRH